MPQRRALPRGREKRNRRRDATVVQVSCRYAYAFSAHGPPERRGEAREQRERAPPPANHDALSLVIIAQRAPFRVPQPGAGLFQHDIGAGDVPVVGIGGRERRVERTVGDPGEPIGERGNFGLGLENRPQPPSRSPRPAGEGRRRARRAGRAGPRRERARR